jgi:hypothetical protein
MCKKMRASHIYSVVNSLHDFRPDRNTQKIALDLNKLGRRTKLKNNVHNAEICFY